MIKFCFVSEAREDSLTSGWSFTSSQKIMTNKTHCLPFVFNNKISELCFHLVDIIILTVHQASCNIFRRLKSVNMKSYLSTKGLSQEIHEKFLYFIVNKLLKNHCVIEKYCIIENFLYFFRKIISISDGCGRGPGQTAQNRAHDRTDSGLESKIFISRPQNTAVVGVVLRSARVRPHFV